MVWYSPRFGRGRWTASWHWYFGIPVVTRERRTRQWITARVRVRAVLAVAAREGIIYLAQRRRILRWDAGLILGWEPFVLQAADLSSAAHAVVCRRQHVPWMRKIAYVRAQACAAEDLTEHLICRIQVGGEVQTCALDQRKSYARRVAQECGMEAMYSHPVYMFWIIFPNKKVSVVDENVDDDHDCPVGFMILIVPLDVDARQFGIQETRSEKYTVFLFERQDSETLADPGCIIPSAGHVGFLAGLLKSATQFNRSLFGKCAVFGS